MKKSLLAAAVLSAVSFGAHADGVELYGIADISVATITNSVSPNANFGSGISTKAGVANTVTQTFNGMLPGAIQASRWGIKGSEDLGNGMKAIFQLESGIQLNNGALANSAQSLIDKKASNGAIFGSNGSTNGELFSRQAWVGLSDAELGTIKFGKNYAFMYDVYAVYDPVQFAALFSPLGTSGTYGGGNGVSENLRQANSVKYTGKMGDINYGAMYKFGNVAGSSSAQSAYGFNIGYDKGPFGIQAVYQGATDAIAENTGGTVAAPGLALTAMNTNAILVAAKYKFSSDLTGKASYQRYTKSAPSDLLVTSPGTYNNQTVASIANQSTSASVNISSFGGDYNITPKLNLALGYFVVNYDAQGTTLAFTENYASALLDYSLSKRTDVYAGFMNQTTGQAGITNQTTSAIGMRHKF